MSTSFNGLNSSPLGGVQPFEYQDISRLDTPGAASDLVIDLGASGHNCDGCAGLTHDELAERLEQARLAGMQEGEERARAAFEAERVRDRAKITATLAAFDRERQSYYLRVEKELVQLALAVAAKILHREAQVDPSLVASLAKVAIERLHQNTPVVIRVARQEFNDWRHHLEIHVEAGRVEVIADASMESGDCVLETEVGTLNLGLESQLKEIEKGFFDLLAQRPQPR